MAFGGRGCFFSNRKQKKLCRIFNATLGYPGEGPKKKNKTTAAATWGDLLGPMCIFLDDQWCDGNLIEVRENHVLYSLSEDPSEQYILQKDEAYKLIRSRKVVKSNGKGQKYNGSNPLIFGPDGACIYGKKIRERKDRAGFYRLEIKFKPTQSAKVKTIKINLGKHVRLCLLYFFSICFYFQPCCCLHLTHLFIGCLVALQATLESADAICDAKIRQWLHDRKKHADPKRKRSRNNQKKKVLNVATVEGNTPKRHTRSTRHAKRDLEEERKVFSPIAGSMVSTPVVQRVKHKKVKKQKNKKKNPIMVCSTVSLLPALPVCFIVVRPLNF